MKKKLRSLFYGVGIAILSLNGSAAAQAVLDENFENSFPPEAWTEHVVGGNGWMRYYGGGAEDDGSYSCASSGAKGDVWLVTPLLLPAEAQSELQFYYMAEVPYEETMLYDGALLDVYVSSTGSSVDDFLLPAVWTAENNQEAATGFSKEWQQATVSLADYIGTPVYVAFRVSGNDLVEVGIDEVSGIPLAVFAQDLAIEQVWIEPENMLFAGETCQVLALVKNVGTTAMQGTLSLEVNGKNFDNQSVNLGSGELDTLAFEPDFVQAGEYDMVFSLSDDDNALNNTYSKDLFIHEANTLAEDFYDEAFPPDGWLIYCNEDYDISRSSVGASDVSGCAVWQSLYEVSETNPAVRTLVTPQLRPENSSVLDFCAWVDGIEDWADGEEFRVLLSETGSDLEDFADTLQVFRKDGSVALPTQWTAYEISLAEYAGKDVFVAFQLFQTSGDCYFYLDDVQGDIPLSSFAKDACVRMAGLVSPHVYHFAGQEKQIMYVVDNNGSEALTDLKVSMLVNGEESDSRVLELEAGQVTDTLYFSYVIPEAGHYDITVSVPEDDNNVNNEQNVAFDAYPEDYFIEGFEDAVFPPRYWDVDEAFWGWSLYEYDSYSGNACASSGDPGLRLMSPLLDVREKDSLCFFVSPSWGETVYLLLSSADGRVWDTVMIDTLASDGWEKRVIRFEDQEAGFYGNRYFAWTSLSESFYIDEVSGCRLADRSDQFSLLSAGPVPGMILLEGQEAEFQIIVYNDGKEAQKKEISLYLDEEWLASATTEEIASGSRDTLFLTCFLDSAVAKGSFQAVLPQDASVYDNAYLFEAPVYKSGIWRLEEDFEDENCPFWLLGSDWYQETIGSANNGGCLQRDFYGADSALAVSPYMDLRFDEYEIRIDIYRTSASSENADKVDFGFAAQPQWEDVAYVDYVDRLPNGHPEGKEGWDTYVFRADLSQLQSGFFLMLARESGEYSSYESMMFDNLRISPVLGKDAEAVAIISPSDSVWAADSVKQSLSVRLLNSGEDPLTAATLHYGCNGVELGVLDWTGNLQSGADTNLMLASDFILPNADTLLVYVEVESEGDENEWNDRIEKALFVKQAYELPFVANFEDSAWDKDWQNFTYSHDGEIYSVAPLLWRQGDTLSGIEPIFGNGCAYSASMDDDLGPLEPDNWFVTPGLAITHPKAWLSFYVKASDPDYFAEAYQVLISTRSDRDTTLFSQLYADTLASEELQHVVLPLDGYKGEVLNIAFRHANCTDMARLLLDSVHVYYPDLFNITANVNPENAGTVEGAGEYILEEEVILTAIGNEGWKFTGWYEGENLVSTENPYRFECEGDAKYEARFEEVSYTITLSSGEGGTVSPSGEQSVKHGADLAVTITADAGYVIEDVLVDGESVGAVESYTFEEVESDHSLEASFKPDVANERLQAASLHVYPNPWARELHIESSLPMESLRVVDLQGREVAFYDLNGKEKASIRPALAKGLYLLIVEYVEGQTSVQRIVKSEK